MQKSTALGHCTCGIGGNDDVRESMYQKPFKCVLATTLSKLRYCFSLQEKLKINSGTTPFAFEAGGTQALHSAET